MVLDVKAPVGLGPTITRFPDAPVNQLQHGAFALHLLVNARRTPPSTGNRFIAAIDCFYKPQIASNKAFSGAIFVGGRVLVPKLERASVGLRSALY